MTPSSELQLAIDAAKAGALTALSYYKNTQKLTIRLKSDSSPVSIADEETENTIKTFIKTRDPNAQFLAEESGGNLNAQDVWIIDPIDGTRSFNRGIPTWAILIGRYTKGSFSLGVCYFPALDTLLWAEEGKGTFLDGQKVEVSKIAELKNAYIGYGSPKYFKKKDILLDLIEKSGSARSPDATYITFLISSGKMDGMIDGYAKPWDFAPFIPILSEAGGKITNLQGKPLQLTDTGYIASNLLLHEEIVRIVMKYA